MSGNEINGATRRDYLSYLLRVWRVEVEDQTAWRVSLESPSTGELQGFADLEGLHRYLRAKVQQEGGGGARS